MPCAASLAHPVPGDSHDSASLAAVGLLPQPGASGTSVLTAPKFVLLLFPPWPLLWSAAGPHSPESLSAIDLTWERESWGLPAPWDLCIAAKLLEPGQCMWHWTGGTGTVVVGHDHAGAWISWCAQQQKGEHLTERSWLA